ncbi:alpha/beta hydrolase [Methylocaldum sp.]|uniref:RBBP9/YdeN family alpha/beta hydrolase n=1 Tax=Methylocaldum sp. TaxID=1969727 RepID=UPI002D554EE9|nr:alpha/beta hydrolase [Methylocaldum sp.]HYE35949.1 alpha/beta hydrolase [Methylocaldum sp.]
MQPPVLILPGVGNSGSEHWQTRWEINHPAFRRVQQREWDKPVCDEWIEQLEIAVSESGPRTILVAHSLGCLLVAHWAQRTRRSIRGALLVAAPDPGLASFPRGAVGFSPVPRVSLPFPSTVVASPDDPYGSPAYARRCAAAWGSRFVEVAPCGHINASSGLGDWEEGFELLRRLIDG